MGYPITPVVYPSDLKGCSNGKLADATLVTMTYPNTKSGRLHHLAARAFNALDAAVKTGYGETLTATSTPDCYRSYDQQYNLFMKRYTTTPQPGQPTKQWNGQTWYLKPGMAGASTPGNSNHGWGLARDTGEYVSGSVKQLTSASAWDWLIKHADEYGISWENSESWHLRYVAGDKVPAAVIAYETGGVTPLTPPTGDGYMVDAMRSDVYKGCPAGDMVRQCQVRLNMKGAAPPVTEDGQFGAGTETAVRAFQAANGLGVDGRVGPKTWAKLEC